MILPDSQLFVEANQFALPSIFLYALSNFMKICIEARMMGAENTRGLGRYIQELVTAMIEVASDNEYTLITRTANHPLKDKVKTVVADIPWYSLQEQLRIPKVLKGLNVDIVHVPHWNVPLSYSGPLVTTIHDLLLRHQPASAKASTRSRPVRMIKYLGFRAVLDHAVKASDRICVPTEFTKQDLINLYPSVKEKVIVTGEGIARLETKFESRSSNLDSKFDIQRSGHSRFLLYVGSAYPHKRLDLLLEAWEELSKLYPDMYLVIAGEIDDFMQRLITNNQKTITNPNSKFQIPNSSQNSSQNSSGAERVQFLGKVSDARLSELYRGATALVCPSSFEGFGLTPLEALARGCPVVSSDATCLPEVLGKNGVIYFKTGSKDGMLEAIKTVVDNQGKFRDSAARAAVELVERHSWKKAALKTLEAYQLAVSVRRHGRRDK
ncbi:MAG: glycosyltransferase family 1 protein [Patescibacteria group bacterium]|nr:glycosyltransferase family 1 protein [Patescibacteria group bacterium]